jgi:NADPH-dependent curcumin reductase CurA
MTSGWSSGWPTGSAAEGRSVADRNRQFVLRERPSGRIDDSTFELVESEVPEIGDGEALVRNEWISVDPTNRAWINDTPTYLPPVGIGEVMRALGLGRVVESKSPNYEEGQLVQGLVGWQEWAVASDEAPLMPVPDVEGVSPSAFLGVLGMTGLTAWVGINDIGKPQEGETVVVSAATGAVGSVAGQLAKARGARVVGIAGGAEKCKLLTDELGLDAAVDRKADDWQEQLVDATPDGIDVDFENVGGEIMELIFARLNLRARVALCGLISGYNDADPPPGPRTFGNVLRQRALVKGFIVLDHFGQIGEATSELGELMKQGKLKPLETVVEGFEALPTAVNMLFDGANTGKLVVKLDGAA